MKRFLSPLAVAIAGLSTTTHAAIVTDFESNNTQATAQDIAPGTVLGTEAFGGPADLSSFRIDGSITAGDIDYFAATINFTRGGITLMDIFLDGPGPDPVQLLVLDAASGRVIDFASFDTRVPSLFTIQLENVGALPGVQTIIFAVSAGRDLNPADGNDSGFLGFSTLTGQIADFDGRDFETNELHDESFNYSLVFLPNYVPAPGSALALTAAAAFAARRRR